MEKEEKENTNNQNALEKELENGYEEIDIKSEVDKDDIEDKRKLIVILE